MSKAEQERIMLAMPNFGDKWYTGDSPTEFLSALNTVQGILQDSLTRRENYLKSGRVFDAEKAAKESPLTFPGDEQELDVKPQEGETREERINRLVKSVD